MGLLKADKDLFGDFLSPYVDLRQEILIDILFVQIFNEFCHILDPFCPLLTYLDTPLGLILSYGISVDDINIEEAPFSDRKPTLFDTVYC